MEKQWVCSENPKHIFDSVGDGFCPEGDGGVLVPKETIKKQPNISIGGGTIQYEGKDGIGILVFDLSGSMRERLDPNSGNPLSKIEAVSNAFGTTIATLLHGGGGSEALRTPDHYFLALIGFSDNAKILGIYQLASMKKGDYTSTWHFWKQQVLNFFDNFGDMTNITRGLEVAKEIYEAALQGNIATHYSAQFNDLNNGFEIGSQRVHYGGDVIEIPNIRVLIYSDGEHNTGGAFSNPFINSSLTSSVISESKRMVNGVISIYFGPPGTNGAKQMDEIAGVCPVHGEVGTIPISSIEHYKYLRDLIHLSSKASGFCIECTKTIL
ncbi:hypothetical protein FKZ61_008840 [Litorilinea aerophila]|uniref:VWA domain-containing protein n=1 Tax=Litorilinea aerophila TaxID=1204385 RepID=A0A540VHB9_9CHLR|nr:hypothetical protein [Litorilinea aerophila]MCC9076216.1 hypothetical protein [Litorilinea aerophila]